MFLSRKKNLVLKGLKFYGIKPLHKTITACIWSPIILSYDYSDV